MELRQESAGGVEQQITGPLLDRARLAFSGFELRTVARTPSTQDVVLRAASAGAAEGFCCVADEQTAGRGRQGRRWDAAPGSALLCSVLLRPGPGVAWLGLLPLAAGLAVSDCVLRLGVTTQLKWPNDVLLAGAKLAGVLVESRTALGVQAVVIGVGMNLRVSTFGEGVSGASLHRAIAPPPRGEALVGLLEALRIRRDQLAAGDAQPLLQDWRSRAVGLGRTVAVQSATGVLRGIARDLDADGALLVDTGSDTVRVLAGDVHLVS